MTAVQQDILHEEDEFDYTQKIEIRKLDNGAPMRWLSKGISDFKVSPMLSLMYGVLYAAIGLILMYFTYHNPIYTFGMVTIFYLAGPVIAVGLYCMSRHIEAGVKPTFNEGCRAMCYNPVGVIGFSIVIGMLIVFWSVITAALFAVYFGSMTISGNVIETMMANKQIVPFTFLLTIIGLFFAVVCFSLSAISIPLMTHRKADVVTAMVTSVRAVKKNPVVMLTWAFAIVALIGLGFAFAFVGVALTLPIVGHASWHAYRELVVDDRVMTAEDCDLPIFPFMRGKLK
ncbi:DUF2189 domain-containing protein [Cocleimonas flava]|jgi:uncharacterized membrane protein|uniref:Putative membrane protein n=1 Tax=Cocleimonas flava TaxID=634765 RepID=A0A4R1EX00_9GAMM|nr:MULTISPECIES: DUF2189 domain-containing protein [Cocleimonas]MEB8434234.1 DUF2189 domain-containing protein [Cocleimonas sp. KMM 6892]MEC4717147.1 DUF2189 domain-containing protein [Cocleimonas sp. KMM 6895]MEC4746506.1 DUF2189 domain-containing protein [Cocleimonas sp. KMM 6896]TCJ84484.1 putative membrane protein [Cocleimonas flava]